MQVLEWVTSPSWEDFGGEGRKDKMKPVIG